MVRCLVDWFVGWSVDLFGGLIGWFCRSDGLLDFWLVGWFGLFCFVGWLVGWLVCLFDWFVASLLAWIGLFG